PLAAPVDAVGEAQEAQRVPADHTAGGEGAVRDRHPFADVGRDRLLPLQHGVDVAGLDRAGVHQRLAAQPDRGLPVRRAGLQPDRAGRRRPQTLRSLPSLTALTILVTAGSPMKTWNGTTGLPGELPRARWARPAWQITRSASAGTWSTGACSTVTENFFSCLRSWLASMTLLPMPASQATTSLWMSLPLIVVITSHLRLRAARSSGL